MHIFLSFHWSGDGFHSVWWPYLRVIMTSFCNTPLKSLYCLFFCSAVACWPDQPHKGVYFAVPHLLQAVCQAPWPCWAAEGCRWGFGMLSCRIGICHSRRLFRWISGSEKHPLGHGCVTGTDWYAAGLRFWGEGSLEDPRLGLAGSEGPSQHRQHSAHTYVPFCKYQWDL